MAFHPRHLKSVASSSLIAPLSITTMLPRRCPARRLTGVPRRRITAVTSAAVTVLAATAPLLRGPAPSDTMSAIVCRPSREGVARHRVLVPIQPEPGPARGDHAVNRQQPFSQNGTCDVQIFKPGSRRRDGHHMRARLDKGVV